MAYIYNDNSNTLVSGTGSNDSIENYRGDNVTIIGGKGNDSIENLAGVKLTMEGGTGKDSIKGNDGNDSLSGGTGVLNSPFLCKITQVPSPI